MKMMHNERYQAELHLTISKQNFRRRTRQQHRPEQTCNCAMCTSTSRLAWRTHKHHTSTQLYRWTRLSVLYFESTGYLSCMLVLEKGTCV